MRNKRKEKTYLDNGSLYIPVRSKYRGYECVCVLDFGDFYVQKFAEEKGINIVVNDFMVYHSKEESCERINADRYMIVFYFVKRKDYKKLCNEVLKNISTNAKENGFNYYDEIASQLNNIMVLNTK